MLPFPPLICYNYDIMANTFLGKLLITFLMSMVPVIELRGALPSGVALGLSPWTAFGISVIGNMVPVPFIILFIRRILEWMKRFDAFRRIAEKLESKAKKHEDKIVKYEALGLFILVALPLPGTGAWTGSLVAALFDLRLRNAVPVIFAGVIAAGLIVLFITYGVVLLT